MSCGLQLFAPKSQQFNLIFSGSPYRRLGQGRLDNHPERAMEWESLPPFPDYGHYSPPPFNCLCKTLCTATRASRSVDRRRNKWHWTGWLLARAGYVPPVAMSCVYGICAFVLRCFFFCSQTVLQMEHSLGVKIFFPSLSPHVKAVFF